MVNLKDGSNESSNYGRTTWNYRVVKRGEYLGIYEAYYDDRGNVHSLSLDPVSPEGEDLAQLKTTLKLMLEALGKGVLDYEQIISK